MPTPDRNLLLRYLGGDLSPSERDRMEQILDRDAEARARLDRLRSLRNTLATVDRSFDDGFADRVLSRLPDAETAFSARPEPALYDVLQDVFFRVALVTVLLIGAIGGYNIAVFDDDTTTPVEAALGLPDATLQAAAYDALLPPEE